jgi:hypothetical protein
MQRTRSVRVLAATIVVVIGGGLGAAPTQAQATFKPESAEARFDRMRLERAALMEAIRLTSVQPETEETHLRLAALETERLALDSSLAGVRAEVQEEPGITGPREPQDPQGLRALPVLEETSTVSSGTAFNPSLAVIPDGVFYRNNPAGAAAGLLAAAEGFGHAHGHEAEEADGHSHGGAPSPGFALRETEIAFTGSADVYFDVAALLAVGEDGVEVEEVYGQTRRFLPGLSLRFGKFLSGFGYQNRQHPHQWDFVDASLPYALLTSGGISDAGVRLTWLPSLPFFAQIGVEALQGTNEAMASQLGAQGSPFFSEKGGPRLFTGFVRVSPNLGFDHALQFGASFARSRQHQMLVEHHHEEGHSEELAQKAEAFEGHAGLLGLELVWKFDSPQPYGKGDGKLQAEYLRLVRDLDLVGQGDAPATGETLRTTQDGLYVQGVYGFASRLTAGLRFDLAGLSNAAVQGDLATSFAATSRLTASVAFDPTEFSRLRLQYSRGSVPVTGVRETYDEVYVQFQLSLGAHGAHSF